MLKKFLISFIAITLVASSLIASPHVVFDFGGVMNNGRNQKSVRKYLRQTLHLSHEKFKRVNREKKEALKEGATLEEFWMAYAYLKDIKLPNSWTHTYKMLIKETLRINPEMYAMVAELKKKQIPVAMLSNIDGGIAKLVREFGFYEPFNPCLLSCEIGFEKPDPRAFQALIKELNVPACDIIFIDNLKANIIAAQKLGINAILFKSTTQIRAELVKRGLL